MTEIRSNTDGKIGKNLVIVAIGSNIEPDRNTKKCIEIFRKEHTLLGVADWIQTTPDGYLNQPDFLNGAACLQTEFTLETFRIYLKDLEKRLGRVIGPIKAGPRTIDVDLILWNDQIIHQDYYEKYYTKIPVDQLIRKLEIHLSQSRTQF